MAEIGDHGLIHWIEVPVNDPVKIKGNLICGLTERIEVKSVPLDKLGECDRSKVANCSFFGGRVLDNLGAEVGRLDRSQVLLVRLAVGCILVENIGNTGS